MELNDHTVALFLLISCISGYAHHFFKACGENCDSFPKNKIFIEYCWIWGGQICDRKSHFDNKAKETQQKQADIKCRFVHLRLWSVTPVAGSKQHSCLAWSKNVGLLPEQQPVCQDWQLKYRSCLNTFFFLFNPPPISVSVSTSWGHTREHSESQIIYLIKNQPKHLSFDCILHFYTHIFFHTFSTILHFSGA